MTLLARFAWIVLLLPMTLGAQASAITGERAWARPTPPRAPTAAVYLEISNTGAAADRLLGVECDLANTAELHETYEENGVMRMRSRSDGIVIAPGRTVALEPGGLHIMLIGLKQPLLAGDSFTLKARFAEAGVVPISVRVATP